MTLPLPPWPRRLVPEVFRNRLAQHTANGLCTCAPSVLSPHLAARWRKLPIFTRLSALLRGVGCDMPSWGSFPLRCACVPASTHRRSHPAVSLDVPRLALPFLANGFADVAIRAAGSVTFCPFERKALALFREQNHSILQHVQGSPVARTPSSRLACTPVGLVSSRRHPWGFPFRGLTSSKAGRPCRSAVPFFSLAGRVVVISVVCLAAPGGRSDGSSVFRPIAPGFRRSPMRGPSQFTLSG